MIDRIFAPVLTFILLIAGTVAVVSGLFIEMPAPGTQVAQGMSSDVIVMDTVVVTGKREASATSAQARADVSAQASQSVAAGADTRGLLLRRARD